MVEETFSIQNLTKGKPPRLPFAHIKEAILGKGYTLSLVFLSEKKSRELNKHYRNKDKATNVLSFPYTKKNGEIFICMKTAKAQCAEYDRTWQQFVGFLVIHGCLHLKGMEHSAKMELQEEKFSKKFKC